MRIFILFFCLAFASPIWGQDPLLPKATWDSIPGTWDVEIRAVSFFKNNEYFSNHTNGFTSIGSFIQHRFRYQINAKTKAKVGLHALRFAGGKTTEWLPLFQIEHRPIPEVRILMGQIEGTLHHQLEEPLFRFDGFFQNNVEYGLQTFVNTRKFDAEVWVNWVQHIQPNDPFQEKFFAGVNGQWKAIDATKIKTTWVVQMLGTHHGGQIDTSPLPDVTVLGGNTGFIVSYVHTPDMEFFGDFRIFGKTEKKVEAPQSYFFEKRLGHAYQSFLGMRWKKNSTLKIGYWKGHAFNMIGGEYLYFTTSEIYTSFVEPERELLVAKLQLPITASKHFGFHFRFDGYYDPVHATFNHAAGLYAVWNQVFVKR